MGPRPARNVHRHTYEAYLALESESSGRHEYLDGEIYAMAGGSIQHAALAVAVSSALSVQLQGRPCVVYSSDLKVRVMETGLATYPDATVICGPPECDPQSSHVVTNPSVVVEVTSPGTEDWDRGEKLDHYKTIPSLREIVLVSHRERRVDVYTKTAGGSWELHESRVGAVANLPTLGCKLSVDELYVNVDVPT